MYNPNISCANTFNRVDNHRSENAIFPSVLPRLYLSRMLTRIIFLLKLYIHIHMTVSWKATLQLFLCYELLDA